MGFQVLFGEFQDLLLAQHIEVDLSYSQRGIFSFGDHRQTLGIGFGFGSGDVVADIKAIKQHLPQAESSLFASHGIINIAVGAGSAGRRAVSFFIAYAATQIDRRIIATLGSIMLIESCLIQIKRFLYLGMRSKCLCHRLFQSLGLTQTRDQDAATDQHGNNRFFHVISSHVLFLDCWLIVLSVPTALPVKSA